MRIGFLELAVILAIILLVFGPKQLPKLTAAIGDSAKEFRKNFDKKEENSNVEEIKDDHVEETKEV